MKNSGYIKTEGRTGRTMRIESRYEYIVFGAVRGLVSEHRMLQAAKRSLRRDRKGCESLGGGAYSDAKVYQSTDEGWTVIA